MQVADQAGARRPELRVSLPVDVLIHHLLRLLAQRGQLVRGDVQVRVPELGDALPLLRLGLPDLQPAHHVLEVALRDHRTEQLRRHREIRVLRDVGQVGEHGGGPPGTLPALAPAGLLDQAVLGQLAQVEGHAGRALAEQFRRPGRGQRALDPQQPDEGQPDRMRQGPQRPGVPEPGDRAICGPAFGLPGRVLSVGGVISHRCQHSFAKSPWEVVQADMQSFLWMRRRLRRRKGS